MSMLIDVILLGLYFDDADDGTDHAPSKALPLDIPNVLPVRVLLCAGETRRNWQFSAA